MPNVWPATLPRPREKAKGDTDSNIIEFQVDAGPKKRRRRTTKPTNNQKVTLVVNGTQLAVFFDWYNATAMNGGVNTFEWLDPTTGDTEEAYFVGKPKWVNTDGGETPADQYYRLMFVVEWVG